jgi:serine phosphatase RsbU (regulator of sigma subunit)
VQQILPTGPLFSDLPGARWDTARFTLDESDLLVIYTDGITEARSPTGEEFGEDRLAGCLAGAVGNDLDAIADEVMGRVHTFGGGRLNDDATLVLVSRQPVGGGPSPGQVGPEQATADVDQPVVHVARRGGTA